MARRHGLTRSGLLRRLLTVRPCAVVAMLLAVAVLGPARAADAQSPPAVTNSGFETPDAAGGVLTFTAPSSFTGWTVDVGSVDVVSSSVWTAAQGNQSVDLSGDSAGSVFQDLTTTAGARYALSFSLAGNPLVVDGASGCGAADRVKQLDVHWGPARVGTYSFDTSGHTTTAPGWQTVRALAEATGSSTRLRFTSLSTGACGPAIDSVALATPSTGQTATTIASSGSPTVSGQAVTFTARVIGASAQNPPTGAMQFKANGSSIGAPVVLDANGEAQRTTSSLPVGTHTVEAVYQPSSASFDPSQAQLVQQITMADTVSTLSVAPDPAVAGQAATFTAAVTAKAPGSGTPTGTVQFAEADGTPIVPPQALNSSGAASIVASAGAGDYVVRATYSGDARFTESSATVPQRVDRADTTTSIITSQNPVAPGGTVYWTVAVNARPPAAVTPFGPVQFTIDGQPIGPAIPIDQLGQVVVEIRVPDLPQTATIGAAYVGDADTKPSSASLQQTVAAPPGPSTPPPPVAAPQTDAQRLAAMTTGLLNTLRRRGLGGLLSVRQSFTAIGPGVLSQRIYSPTAPRSATRTALGAAAAPSRVLATGRKSFTGAGTASMTLRLTAAGRRALRRSGRLKIAAVTRFAPGRGKATVRVDRLTVKRSGKARRSRMRLDSVHGWRLRP